MWYWHNWGYALGWREHFWWFGDSILESLTKPSVLTAFFLRCLKENTKYSVFSLCRHHFLKNNLWKGAFCMLSTVLSQEFWLSLVLVSSKGLSWGLFWPFLRVSLGGFSSTRAVQRVEDGARTLDNSLKTTLLCVCVCVCVCVCLSCPTRRAVLVYYILYVCVCAYICIHTDMYGINNV